MCGKAAELSRVTLVCHTPACLLTPNKCLSAQFSLLSAKES